MDSLLGIYNYIFEKSPQNTLMVFNELTNLGDSLSNNNLEFSKDLIINNEAVRFVSKWDYKIIYERKMNHVLIIDVFSSKQNPSKLIEINL